MSYVNLQIQDGVWLMAALTPGFTMYCIYHPLRINRTLWKYFVWKYRNRHRGRASRYGPCPDFVLAMLNLHVLTELVQPITRATERWLSPRKSTPFSDISSRVNVLMVDIAQRSVLSLVDASQCYYMTSCVWWYVILCFGVPQLQDPQKSSAWGPFIHVYLVSHSPTESVRGECAFFIIYYCDYQFGITF